MTSIVLVLVGVAVFLIAVISPHAGGKIQHKTNVKSGALKRAAEWLWDPLTWVAKSSIEFMRKTILKLADLGKKTRRN